jgi:hypothetical protein
VPAISGVIVSFDFGLVPRARLRSTTGVASWIVIALGTVSSVRSTWITGASFFAVSSSFGGASTPSTSASLPLPAAEPTAGFGLSSDFLPPHPISRAAETIAKRSLVMVCPYQPPNARPHTSIPGGRARVSHETRVMR